MSDMKIERTSQGLIDATFTMLDKVHNDECLEFKDKLKMHSSLLKDIRDVVKLELEHKRMLLRAPDITRNRSNAIDFKGNV